MAHFERIRPVLLADAKALSDYSRRVAEQGHLLGWLRGADIARNDSLMWDHDLLVADLVSHFPDYAVARGQARRDLASHDERLRELVTRIGAGFSVTADVSHDDASVRRRAGEALVHRCTRDAYGMRLDIKSAGGYSYGYSMGGSGTAGGGSPGPELLETWNAFRTYEPDTFFESECATLQTGADELGNRLAKLADEARAWAETMAFAGDCRYLGRQ